MAKKILTYQGAVQTWECDSNDHMNVMYYINKFELAGRNLGFEMGFYNDYLASKNYGIAVVEQNIKYVQEVMEDELIRIESHLIHIGNKSFTTVHEMSSRERDSIVSTMKITLVLLDKTLRKAVPIPDHIKANMQEILWEESES